MSIRIHNLSFSYGKRQALQDIALSLDAGQFHALLGRNGSGKSTLLRILSTLAPLQTGEVDLLGLSLPNQASELRRRMAIVFQSPAVDDVLTVEQNLLCHAAMYGLPRSQARERMNETLAAGKLDARRRDTVKTLSGGMKRRVELAKVLMCRPQLLLMDEPTSGLDAEARRAFWNQLQTLQEALRSEGHAMTVLYTTHLFEEIDDADSVTLLDEGQVAFTGTPAELHQRVGGQILRVQSPDVQAVDAWLRDHGNRMPAIDSQSSSEVLEVMAEDAVELLRELLVQRPGTIERVEILPPKLDHVLRLLATDAEAPTAVHR